MSKVYLLVYSDFVGDRSQLKQWADASALVTTWRYDLPYSLYLVSEASAAELCADIQDTFGSRGRFLLTEVSENRQGCLPADTWYFLQNKRAKSMAETASQTA